MCIVCAGAVCQGSGVCSQIVYGTQATSLVSIILSGAGAKIIYDQIKRVIVREKNK